MLVLEEHRNRKLPPQQAIASAEEYEHRAERSVNKFTAFLAEEDVSCLNTITSSRYCVRIWVSLYLRHHETFSTLRPTMNRWPCGPTGITGSTWH